MSAYGGNNEGQREIKEGVLRTGLIAKGAAEASTESKRAKRAFRDARDALLRKANDEKDPNRTESLQKAVEQLATGLEHLTNQIARFAESNTAGHIIRDRLLKVLVKRMANKNEKK